jgi:hypothetical protein
MTFKYDEIVPWGRNYDEYKRMFDLTDNELRQKILGCGDGPASFNFECNTNGGDVTSIDPIYLMSKGEIKKRIDETYEDVLTQTERNKEKFNWNLIKSVDDLGRIRMEAMEIFLNSYDEGRKNKKYIPGMLPNLPFADKEFEITLCSHFLFLYTDNLSYEFHFEAINEMLRVSKETRIFPILDVNAKKSPYVQRAISAFNENQIEIRKVNYEFQKGGNELFIVRS